jgi:hypothetical protein
MTPSASPESMKIAVRTYAHSICPTLVALRGPSWMPLFFGPDAEGTETDPGILRELRQVRSDEKESEASSCPAPLRGGSLCALWWA